MDIIDQITLSRRDYAPERAAHRHAHAQVLFPDRGALRLELDGTAGSVERGALAVVPPGIEHAFWAEGPNRCIVIDLPATLYDELAPAGTAPPRPFRRMDARLGVVSAALDLELGGGAPADRLVAESLGLFAVAAVLRGGEPACPPAPIGARRIARAAADVLRSRATEPLSVSDVAAAVGASPSHLQRCFRSEMGCTIVAYAQGLRLEAARALLTETDLTVLEVAHRVGFASQSHLSRLFSRELGCSPARYRATARTRTIPR